MVNIHDNGNLICMCFLKDESLMKNLNHAGNNLVHINSYSQTHNYISNTDNG